MWHRSIYPSEFTTSTKRDSNRRPLRSSRKKRSKTSSWRWRPRSRCFNSSSNFARSFGKLTKLLTSTKQLIMHLIWRRGLSSRTIDHLSKPARFGRLLLFFIMRFLDHHLYTRSTSNLE